MASYSGCAQTSDPNGREFVRITVDNWSGGQKSRRTAKGAETVWFIRHDLTDTAINKAMWRAPASRCKVLDRRERWIRNQPEFQPWTDDTRPRPPCRNLLQSTVFRLDTTTYPPALIHARLPAAQFLTEVLSGQRRWISAGQSGMTLTNFGMPQPGWVRTTGLEQTQQPHKRPPALVPSPARPPSPPPEPAVARRPDTREPEIDALPAGCALAALIGFIAVVALMAQLPMFCASCRSHEPATGEQRRDARGFSIRRNTQR